jgi:hypothetical protein
MFPPWLQALTPSTTGLASQYPQYRIDIGPAGGVVPASVSVSRATSKITNLGATTATVGNNVGSIESAGLVVEPAHTNVATHSQDFSNAAWVKTGASGAAAPVVTANFAVAPDGTTTASKIVFAAVSTSGQRSDVSFAEASAGSYTFSIWLKGATSSGTIYLYGYDGSNKTPVAVNYTTAWARYTVSYTMLANVGGGFIFGGAQAWGAPILAQTVYAWQGDLTNTATSESAVPTTTTSAACNADVVTDSGTASLPVATGTIYATFTPEWATANAPNAYLVDTRAGTPGTTVGYAFYVDSSGKLSFKVGAQTAVQSSALTWVAGTTYTVRATWANGTITLYQSGTQVATSGSNSMPTSNSATHVGCDSSGANQLTGRLASLIFYGA